MKIYFSPYYTSRVYSPTLPLGSEVCNLQQLVELVELHSGVHYRNYSPLELHVIYMQSMLQMNAEHPDNIYRASLETDPISTARTCLQWRDHLILAAWKSSMKPSKRIEALALTEQYFKAKTLADRVVALPSLIQKSNWLKDVEMELQFNEELMHPAVKKIVYSMRLAGVKITFPAIQELERDCNLRKFRDWMTGKEASADFTENDDTLKILRFENRRHVLRYISQMDAATARCSHWISSRGGDIDMALLSGGKATSGSMMENSLPGIVQLLPLAISMFIKPIDLNKLIAWLRAPRSPIANGVRYKIADEIIWHGGWSQERIDEVVNDYLEGHPELDRGTLKKTLDEFVFFQTEEATKEGFIDFMKRFQTWALQQRRNEYQHEFYSQFDMLIKRTAALLMLADYHPSETIDNDLLSQWEKLASEEGSYEMYTANCDGPVVCSCPGDMIGNSEKSCWVGFSNHQAFKGEYSFLTSMELKELTESGCQLYEEGNEMKAKKIVDLWPLSHTRHLVIVEMEEKEPDEIRSTYSHQWRSLQNLKCTEKPQATTQPQTVELISRSLNGQASINIKNASQIQWRQKESYSSIDLLIQQPFEYLLKYCLRLTPEPDDTINVNTSTGNVAHKVIETLFVPGLKAQDIRQGLDENYKSAFEDALQSCGMILLLPENRLERKNLEDNLKNSVISLIKVFEDNDLVTIKCEDNLSRESAFEDDIAIEGILDMHVKDSRERRYVIDLKWTKYPDKYENQIKEEKALQLDIYHWLLSGHSDDVKSAYFVMPQNLLYTNHHFAGNNVKRHDVNSSLDDRIERIKNSVKYRKQEIRSGSIEVGLETELTDIAYHEEQDNGNEKLVPLEKDGKNKKMNSFSDYKSLYF